MFLAINCVMASSGRGLRTRGGLGFKPGGFSRYNRFDNNIFTVLDDLDEDIVQDGGVHGMFTSLAGNDDGFIPVRGKQSKRQRISSGGQSGPINQPEPQDDELFETDFQDLSTDQKLSLILSKLSINESRVSSIQNKLDTMLNIGSRVTVVENVIRSQNDRLLEYRSIDLEARSRRKNLLFKGISEQRRENCFAEARRFILEELGIDRDMYLERAHRLGRFDSTKTGPIIVAIRDFCDTQEILDASSTLRGTEYGISRDYPSEISKARQSLWKQYKTTREANPRKKVTLEFPARIYVDGVVVADAFPDWYPILQGSRISCPPQTRSSDNTSYVNPMRIVTGSAGRSVNPRDIPTTGLLSMGQQIDSAQRDTATMNDLARSQTPTQQPNSSPERMEDDGARSPSLFDNINISAPRDRSSDNISTSAPRERSPEGNSHPRSCSRGRSPTRKPVSNKQRTHSTSSRGRRGANPARRTYARSQSRSAQSNVSSSIDQTVGAANFKKPNPTDKNKSEREKTVSGADSKQSDPLPASESL